MCSMFRQLILVLPLFAMGCAATDPSANYPILAQFEAGEPDEQQYIQQRANFLNKIRYLN